MVQIHVTKRCRPKKCAGQRYHTWAASANVVLTCSNVGACGSVLARGFGGKGGISLAPVNPPDTDKASCQSHFPRSGRLTNPAKEKTEDATGAERPVPSDSGCGRRGCIPPGGLTSSLCCAAPNCTCTYSDVRVTSPLSLTRIETALQIPLRHSPFHPPFPSLSPFCTCRLLHCKPASPYLREGSCQRQSHWPSRQVVALQMRIQTLCVMLQPCTWRRCCHLCSLPQRGQHLVPPRRA